MLCPGSLQAVSLFVPGESLCLRPSVSGSNGMSGAWLWSVSGFGCVRWDWVAEDAPWERGQGGAVRCSVECRHGGDGPAASSQHGRAHRARRDGAAPLQNSGLCAQLGIKPPQIANRISQVQRAAGHDVLTQKQSISGVGFFLVGGHCSDVT